MGESARAEIVFKFNFLRICRARLHDSARRRAGFLDALVFVIALPNISASTMLAPVVKKELKSYQARLKSGKFECAQTVEGGAIGSHKVARALRNQASGFDIFRFRCDAD